MDSDSPVAPVIEDDNDNDNTPSDRVLSRDDPTKKKYKKVPKRVHKAEREKMKRDHLNDLFLSLANALELSEQVNGKASILAETTRNVKDLLAQIEQLRRENAALLSESQYVSVEKTELEEENSALKLKISELRREINERASESNLDLNIAPPESEEHQKAQMMMNPVYIYPIAPTVGPPSAPHTAAGVSKPLARYASPADEAWSAQILGERPRVLGEELQVGGENSGFAVL
ncbi:unnamed protein product [Cuscuta campestris]|uniref:BHLH domain-containing protein n=1 Tax=Cuscuta campestris TaxID=132261 RepID=A0A484MF57_9ASTE|nr:unnamed protein product [Cuscuta campestris]